MLIVFVLGALRAPVIGSFQVAVGLPAKRPGLPDDAVCGHFFLAVLWKRANAPGVLACMGYGVRAVPA